MATLSYNEILPRKIIQYNNEPCVVLSSHVFRKQQRKPVNQTKLKGLKSGKTLEISFHQSETVQEADTERQEITYIYARNGEVWFHEAGNPKNRFSVSEDQFGEKMKFVKPNTDIVAIVWHDPSTGNDAGEVIDIELPIKVELVVTEAPPSVKGNTAQGGSKQVVLETGAVISTPLFINEGDIVRVNTDTQEYVERAEKN